MKLSKNHGTIEKWKYEKTMEPLKIHQTMEETWKILPLVTLFIFHTYKFKIILSITVIFHSNEIINNLNLIFKTKCHNAKKCN